MTCLRWHRIVVTDSWKNATSCRIPELPSWPLHSPPQSRREMPASAAPRVAAGRWHTELCGGWTVSRRTFASTHFLHEPMRTCLLRHDHNMPPNQRLMQVQSRESSRARPHTLGVWGVKKVQRRLQLSLLTRIRSDTDEVTNSEL